MPGIATEKCWSTARPVTFITKAGGFGDADILVDILRHLKNQ